MNSIWPTEINVPDKVGKTYRFVDCNPCCAVGHAQYEFTVSSGQSLPVIDGWVLQPTCVKTKEYAIWYNLYCDLFAALKVIYPALGRKNIIDENGVEFINDAMSYNWRRTLYLLTWAKLGYTEGMPSDILDLLKLSEIKAVKTHE